MKGLYLHYQKLNEIYSKDKAGMFDHEYINPVVVMTPQEAFYADKNSVPIEESQGKICGEFVMCYPPGIPIFAPGERITEEIIRLYFIMQKKKDVF